MTDDTQARREALLAELATLEQSAGELSHDEPAGIERILTPGAPVVDPNAWQAPSPGSGGEVTAPPVTAPDDPAAYVEPPPEGSTISETTYAPVAGDGSTETTTPGYSHVPCPVCGNASVKTTNVTAALPTPTVRGDSVNPGDQVVACETCGTTIDKGDVDGFEANALAGAFGEEVKTAAEGGTSEAGEEQAAIAREEAELEARRVSLDERKAKLATTEGGV